MFNYINDTLLNLEKKGKGEKKEGQTGQKNDLLIY